MAWILVTPSSRGIGHALTRHLLQTTPASIPIIATTRAKDTKETRESLLDGLKLDDNGKSRLDVQQCDLLSESAIQDLAGYCKERYNSSNKSSASDSKDGGPPPHLRLSFMVPGMLQPEKSPQQISYDTALETLKLNLLSPMMLLKHFVPFLPRKSARLEPIDGLPDSSIMACMSARVGSITDNGLGGWYSYRASKAGLNQLVKSTDLYVKIASATNAGVVGLHPGTVKTGLSKEFWGNVKKEKLFEPEFAAERLVDVVLKAGVKGQNGLDGHRGRCWDWKGEEVPP